MTSTQIVNMIATDSDYRKIVNNISSVYSDDLFQEVLLILLEYDKKKLEAIYKKGYIKWFFIRIVTNQAKSEQGGFYRKEIAYYKSKLPINESILSYEEEEDKEKLLNKVEELTSTSGNICKKEYYERTIFKLYAETKSILRISQMTGIHRKCLTETVNKFKQKAKKQCQY